MADNSLSIIINKIKFKKKIVKDSLLIIVAVIVLVVMFVSIFNLRYGFIEVILFSIISIKIKFNFEIEDYIKSYIKNIKICVKA
ncbi:hypothetical protein JCM1393_29820 [Clostridium carnis]